MAGKKKQQAVTVQQKDPMTPIEEVHALQASIEQYEEQLVTLCEKAKAQIDKQVAQQKAKLTKAKEKMKTARDKLKSLKADQKSKRTQSVAMRFEKATSALAEARVTVQTLQRLLVELKMQKMELKNYTQQFSERQKVIQRFNKDWLKEQKEKLVAKRLKRKTRVVKSTRGKQAIDLESLDNMVEQLDMIDEAETMSA